MILVLLAAVLVSCDPALTALFTPPRPALGQYETCTSLDPLERVAADTPGSPQWSAAALIDPLDAFGAAGPYSRAALARLYAGGRVRVIRGWIDGADRFESLTLLSPYPDPTLTTLLPGTMVIRWTVVR